MRVRIKDIANATGLSATTVSLVLNNKAENIPDKTREHILRTAEAMHYRPNQAAVALARRTTTNLGLIVPDIRNLFFASLAKGVEDTCRQRGWNVFLCDSNNRHAVDVDYVQTLIHMDVAGVIYNMAMDTACEDAALICATLDDYGVDYVMTDRAFRHIPCHRVTVNHAQGGYMATKHLLDLGHRRIACITGPSTLEDSQQRLDGYRRALAEQGIPWDAALAYEGNYELDSGAEGVRALLGAHKDITAIFAFNELSAIGAYRTLRAMGMEVPQDISLVDYDDIYPGEITGIPFTCVRQPSYQIGREAATILMDMGGRAPGEPPMEGSPQGNGEEDVPAEDEKRQICLEPEMIIRGTTAPLG